MSELRWILLAAGLVLIAGVYLWGLRARRRSAAPEHERMTRVEPARVVAVAPEPVREEPEERFEDRGEFRGDEPHLGESPSDVEAEFEEDTQRLRPLGAGRREPRIEPRFDDARFEPDAGPARVEPRLEPRLEPEGAAGPAAAGPEQAPSAPEAPRKAAQKIVALRVVAPPGAQFEGSRLLDALLGDGFAFGRYQIFHRLDEAGRPLVSLASLKEPGTFDPDRMTGMEFRGVALFTVMPGPLPALRAFDELVVTARALATTLGGQLQDERGAPLTVQRLTRLREEVTEFERSGGTPPGA
jgi:cell division protein ZipA